MADAREVDDGDGDNLADPDNSSVEELVTETVETIVATAVLLPVVCEDTDGIGALAETVGEEASERLRASLALCGVIDDDSVIRLVRELEVVEESDASRIVDDADGDEVIDGDLLLDNEPVGDLDDFGDAESVTDEERLWGGESVTS